MTTASSTETLIPLCVPEIRGNELKYLRECIDTNWVSYVGPFVSRLEDNMVRFVGAQHAVATNSGTAALHIALIVAGIEADDEVLVPALTFIAPVNAIRYCNAHPVFIDVTAEYWQMDEQKVIEFLSLCSVRDGHLINPQSGRRITAIIPVHILGHPVNMQPIIEAARRYNLRIIEDATETLGGKYLDRMVGTLGDLACFSYNGNKIITSGGGGMITTDNEEWAHRAKYLTTQARDDSHEYIHHSVGYNYRMTNIQAAVGVAQMERLDEYIGIKRAIAARYDEGLKNVAGLSGPKQAPWAFSTFWLYTILVDAHHYGSDSRKLMYALEQQRIQARPLWAPIHQQSPYRNYQAYKIEVAPELCRRALSLPSSVGLSEPDQQRVISALRDLGRPS
jgi:perosamine synthetase